MGTIVRASNPCFSLLEADPVGDCLITGDNVDPPNIVKVELLSINEFGEPLPLAVFRSFPSSLRRLLRHIKNIISAIKAANTKPTTVNTPATAPFLSKNELEEEDFSSVPKMASLVDVELAAESASELVAEATSWLLRVMVSV